MREQISPDELMEEFVAAVRREKDADNWRGQDAVPAPRLLTDLWRADESVTRRRKRRAGLPMAALERLDEVELRAFVFDLAPLLLTLGEHLHAWSWNLTTPTLRASEGGRKDGECGGRAHARQDTKTPGV
jgi:hypothetical protein